MSSKFKVLSIALIALLAFGFYSATTKADVTGSFGVDLSMSPVQCPLADPYLDVDFIDQPCESTVFLFDFETDLNINIAISGLSMGIHSHAGVTGFEDIILSFAATLGALDITDTFVFAQPFASVFVPAGGGGGLFTFPFLNRIPTCLEDPGNPDVCDTLFVKKRVEASISLGGVTFSNLAMLEDVTFPNFCVDFFFGFDNEPIFGLFGPISFFEFVGICVPTIKTPGATYGTQSQTFGFGDVVTIEGQTPSGITVTAETGICAEQLVNAIKKHLWTERVNADCVGNSTVVKPPVLFSFEKLWIEGIPVAAGLTGDVHVECGSLAGSAESDIFFPCNLFWNLTITGGPIFNSIGITAGFENILGPAVFSDIVVVAAGGPLFIIASLSPADFSVTEIFVQANFTINPDTNPAGLRLRALGFPDLVFFDARLSISRAGLTFFADLDFDVDSTTSPGQFEFDDLTLGLSAEAGIVTVDSTIIIKENNTDPQTAFLLGGNVSFTVQF